MTNYSIILWFILMTVFQCGTYALKRSYIAAAYEHALLVEDEDVSSVNFEENLKRYQKAAKFASSKGADIIVYPEYGIFPPMSLAEHLSVFEDIPDPKKLSVNPCEQRESYSNRPIIQKLSCIAKNNSIVVVANVGDIKNCSNDPNCIREGAFYFNTNVVFDKNGTMLVRYHKENLQIEMRLTPGEKQQDSTFETDFGTFATYTGMDMMFQRPSEVANWPHIDGIMFSTIWTELTPQYSSVSFWRAWGMGNNITIVVSNLNNREGLAVGSGIFNGNYGSIGYTYNPDEKSKIVIAEIPLTGQPDPSTSIVSVINDTEVYALKDDGEAVQKICSRNVIISYNAELRCLDEGTHEYTFVKLTEPSGYVEACNEGMCCSANYSAQDMAEDYYLGVFNGTFVAFSRYFWCEENCLIVRCDASEVPRLGHQKCGTFPRRADTIFHHIELKANFSTPHIYPSVVSSKTRLVPTSEWKYDVVKKSAYEGSIAFDSDSGQNIINAGFKGRCYERDPPNDEEPY